MQIPKSEIPTSKSRLQIRIVNILIQNPNFHIQTVISYVLSPKFKILNPNRPLFGVSKWRNHLDVLQGLFSPMKSDNWYHPNPSHTPKSNNVFAHHKRNNRNTKNKKLATPWFEKARPVRLL